MALPLPDEKTVSNAITQLEALYALEKSTGSKTTRARCHLLQELNDSDLTAVAIILRKKGYIGPDGGAK